MASISTLVDRVKIFVLSSGTGPFALGSEVPAFRGTEALINGATYSYAVESGSNFEVGTGVYLADDGVLARTPILSSRGNAAVAFPAGVQLVFTALAADLTAIGAAFPIIDSLGDDPAAAASQKSVTDAINGLSSALTALSAQVDRILSGGEPWSLPDEADGGAVPPAGSDLGYLSGGVMKIA